MMNLLEVTTRSSSQLPTEAETPRGNEDNSICENETKEAENEKVARCPGADNFDIILYDFV